MRILSTALLLLLVQACKHPLAIVGEGDITDLNGSSRGCTLEQFQLGDAACTENETTSDYYVNYRAVPRPGWQFVRWEGPCGPLSVAPDCSIESPTSWVAIWDDILSETPAPTTTAVFEELESDSDGDGIPDNADGCYFDEVHWLGSIAYELDGNLLSNTDGCGAASSTGESVAFIDDDSRHFLTAGEDGWVGLPESLSSDVFAEDSFEVQLQFMVPDNVELPHRQVLFSALGQIDPFSPGFALIVHGEPYGTQLVLTFSDNEGVGHWKEFTGLITRGQWHNLSLIFDMVLGEWHLVFDETTLSEPYPDGFDRAGFKQVLQQNRMRSGTTFTGKHATYLDDYSIDSLKIHAPAEFALQSDTDRDGVPDEEDAFPNDPEETLDTDNDGIGNNADTDDDDDGVPDTEDEFPLNPDLTSESSRTPKPALPGQDDQTFDVSWTPSKAGSCTPSQNVSPSIAPTTTRLAELSDGRFVYEPAILFEDETFTMMKKSLTADQPILLSSVSNGFTVVGDSSDIYLYDDATHGDLVAGDHVFTRACLSIAQPLDATKDFAILSDGFFVNSALRGTEPVETIAEGVRVNSAGLFLSLGDTYRAKLDEHWLLFTPTNCVACQSAWHLYGDVFDVFVMAPREAWGGYGYTRVHDFIEGTGHNPPYDNDSHFDTPMIDGKEHREYIGVIWSGWPLGGGMTHELGHGLLGINTVDFPEEGARQWNAGDGQHIDSDSTVTGDLQGPTWDPVRGWPYPIKLNNGSDDVGSYPSVYIAQDEQGNPYLRPEDEFRYVWSDIFLYMMGLISAEDSDEVYSKLVNPIYSDCETTEAFYICNSAGVSAEEYVEFGIADMVNKYGPWKSNVESFDPAEIQAGMLHVSDRPHTEAEIVLASRYIRQYTEVGRVEVDGTGEHTWGWATRELSRINTDVRERLLPAANP